MSIQYINMYYRFYHSPRERRKLLVEIFPIYIMNLMDIMALKLKLFEDTAIRARFYVY